MSTSKTLLQIIDGTKTVFVNIYAPIDTTQQVLFLRDLSKHFLSVHTNENLVLGGDFNKILPNIYSDHSAVSLSIFFQESELPGSGNLTTPCCRIPITLNC